MRCDDGLAWHAADALDRKFSLSDVEIVRCHQLSPELAEALRNCEAVIFVDAASAAAAGNGPPGEVRNAEISVPASAARFSHQLSPSALVALAHKLYDAKPRAVSVTLTGECFDHGESLSPVITAALPALVARIEALVQQLLSGEVPPDSNKA
jgi:hydrogenase maturation protease